MSLISLVDLQDAPWQPHPAVAGLLIKIIESQATHPLMDALIAQVLPGGSIPWHVHETASETVYLVAGTGKLLYAPSEVERVSPREAALPSGSALTVQAGVWHSVLNVGDVPLILFAVHTPPTF